jgi:phosphoribosylamine--glycine ligase
MARVLIVAGAEGRGYALAWKLNREGHNVRVAPGNGAIKYMDIGRTNSIDVSDFYSLAGLAESDDTDLTIVGPEEPLAGGIVDHFQKRGLRIFGPTKRYARLEADKIYSSDLMTEYGIPAPFGVGFTIHREAEEYLRDNFDHQGPFVVKARGLHGGKGVIVPRNLDEATDGVRKIMGVDGFNDDVLLQEYLEGREVSTTSLVGGGILTMTGTKDYKPVGENRFGLDPRLNTGGMGVLSPNPWLSDEAMKFTEKRIVVPTIEAIEDDVGKGKYTGVAYGALMLTGSFRPEKAEQVLEFNVRFGAPECEALMMRMKSELYPYLEAAVDGRLDEMPPIEWDDRVAVGVVLATPGYPTGEYKKHLDMEFRGANATEGMNDAEIFFAGVKNDNGTLRNSGGRVAMPVVLADNWEEGREKLYGLIDGGKGIGLGSGPEDTQFRPDIGLDAMEDA